jgi:CubicO group peptidase (beta-lactamase class C family)
MTTPRSTPTRWRGATSVGPLVLAALVSAGTLLGCTASSDPASSSSTRSPDGTAVDRAARSEDVLHQQLSTEEPGCSAAVGVEGEVVWAGARGLADVSTGRPIDATTSFHVASVGKQFTATAVLLLAQEGRLGLDDPVSRWVPDLPVWSDAVTLADLIHHTSGIPDFVDPLIVAGFAYEDRATSRDALAVIAGSTPSAPPGTRLEYSNSNYVLLAEVVRAAAGRPLEEFAREEIFEPLALDMAFDPGATSPDETDPTTARGHERDASGRDWEPAGARWEIVGPGYVQTTPSELVRWADNYRTGQVGGQALLVAQLAGAVPAGTREYGAGIVVTPDGGLWHNGDFRGQVADFSVSPDRRVAVAVACNSYAGSMTDVEQIAANLRSIWFP